jgi:hypothetical protein
MVSVIIVGSRFELREISADAEAVTNRRCLAVVGFADRGGAGGAIVGVTEVEDAPTVPVQG